MKGDAPGIQPDSKPEPSRFVQEAVALFENRSLPESGQWKVFSRGENNDTLVFHSIQTVSKQEFDKENPNIKPSDLQNASSTFNYRHFSTNQVDGDWHYKGTKDGSIVLERDYKLDVEKKDAHDGLVEAVNKVSDPLLRDKVSTAVINAFVTQTEEKLRKIQKNLKGLGSPHILNDIKASGYKVIVAPTIIDAVPELKPPCIPRGWPADSTYENSDGVFDSTSGRIIAPMFVKWDADKWQPVARENVLAHHIGHLLNSKNGFSNTPEFQDTMKGELAEIEKVLARDVENVQNKKGRQSLKDVHAYFSQQNGVGLDEAWASFAGLHLLVPENPGDDVVFRQHFSKSIKIVEQQLKSLK